MSDELIGKKLGGYEILERIGQGGMATVYRARQTSMDRIVALKILPKHLMRDDTYLQRFEREVRIVAQLEHRNIVPVHDYGEDDGQPYIAMRYMPAGSVDDRVKRGAMNPAEIVRIIQQVAPALDYAHSKNVLHRDLKPSNILMDDDGGAYITDFGIARILGTEARGNTITTEGVVGTPSYMSPEQAQGNALDGRSDVYSLGVMIFEMATGRRPFENETPYGIAVMQVTAQPPNPRNLNADISPAMEAVILRALKKQPDNRQPNAATLADELEAALEGPERQDDTQPRPLDLTQPASAPQATVPATSYQPPPASRRQLAAHPPTDNRTPPPPFSSSVGMRSRVRRARRRNPTNFWLSITIGALIGCAILTGAVVVLGMLARQYLDQDSTTQLRGENTPLPTLDQVSESARQTMVGGGNIPGAELETPLFQNATPIPTRQPQVSPTPAPVGQRPALPGDFDIAQDEIVYFDRREGVFNIYRYNLRTGQETQLTTEGNASYPAVSPDGSRMAFQSNRDGDWDIYVMTLASGAVEQLVDTAVDERIPAWSNDGQYIVYASDTREDENFDLYWVRATGGTPQLIYSDGQRNGHARFSPDDRALVFTNGAANDATTWEILYFDLASGETRPLTNNNVRDASPSFRPDGEVIIYNTDGVGDAAVVTLPVNGGALPTTLYDGAGFEWGMHYSPDGAFILFHEELPETSTVYIMRADGSDLQALDGVSGFYPVWIP
jgi:serine/threonine protein kinase/Tol biopolymer transport system component